MESFSENNHCHTSACVQVSGPELMRHFKEAGSRIVVFCGVLE